MPALPLPVLIGSVMIVAGIALGIFVTIRVVLSQRQRDFDE